MEVFADGLLMGESPRWRAGRLWVCDWVAGEVLSFDPVGERRVELRVEGLPFSIDWLPDDRMVVSTSRDVSVVEGGALTAYGATGEGWNEIVVDHRGNTFVDAPGFDLMGGEQARPGHIAVVRPDGTSLRVADEVWFPNGMVVDDETLIVAESYGKRLTAFDIAADGTLSGRRVWADLGDGVPDGICLDVEGAIWYADVPNRRCVRVAQGGEVLESVAADRGCFACMLGGDDGRTLYVVANAWAGVEVEVSGGQVLSHRTAVPHAGRP